MIEGGLARHVRKLAEALVRQGVEVDVLTRGARRGPGGRAERSRARRRRPSTACASPAGRGTRPVRRLGRADERGHARGGRGARAGALDYDLVHGHDWLVAGAAASAGRRAARALRRPRSTRPSTAATRAGSTSSRSRTSTPSSAGWRTAPTRVIVCSYYMRGHVADIFDIDERRVAVIPNGVDPSELRPSGDLARAARELRRAATRSSCCWSGGSSTRRASSSRSTRSRRDRAGRRRALPRRGQRHARGRAQGPGRSGSACRRTARSSAGSATTCCTRSTGSPTCAWCRRSTSRSGSWRSRRWPRGCPCIVADTGGLREVVPVGERVGPALQRRRRRAPGRDDRAPAVDDELRDRLVAEASEHVLRFDWDDIAQRTRGIYDELAKLAAREGCGERDDQRDAAGTDAGRLPADAQPHPPQDAHVNLGAEVVTLQRRPAACSARATREVAERVDRLARALQALGVQQGDRVATFAWNNQRHLELYFAVPCMRRRAAHAQHPPVRRAAHLHRQPRRGPGDLRRRLARADAREARADASRPSSTTS